MFTLNYTSVPEKKQKKKQALMGAFLRLVDIVCYDLDLILFRLDFLIMSNE